MAPPEQEETGEGEESMEEILHSIKKIIADEGDEAAPDGETKKNGKDSSEEKAEEKQAADEEEKDDVPGSDVLELTEVVDDDGNVESLKEADAKESKEEKPAAENKDVLSQIDEAVGPAEEAAEAKPKEEAAKPASQPAAAKPAPAQPAADSAAPGDPMLSEGTTAAVSASVDKLKKSAEPPPVTTTPFPEFESGSSIEALVSQMLRPMIKEWLDDNLPAIVERIVEQEIKRITK